MSHRPIETVFDMPWRSFRGGNSGAWMLHPDDALALDPVVLVDHFRMDQPTFAPHPHAGFSAVTYLFEDSEDGFINRDSLGHTLPIEPGSLHWTQAGSGVLHEEIPRTPGRTSHGLQIFVNSRAADKASLPAVFHRPAGEVPVFTTEGGGRVRVVLGEDVSFGAHTPLALLDVTLPAGADIELPLASGARAFAVVVRGSTLQAPSGVPHALRFNDRGGAVRVAAGAAGVQFVLIAGTPIAEPIFQKGPFIGSSAADVTDMVRRFQSGAMGSLAPTPGAFK